MAEGSTSGKWLAVSVVVLAIVVGIYVWIAHRRAHPEVAHHAMSAAEQSYLHNVEISNAKVSAASNFLGSTLYYLDAQLHNKGTKTVRQLGLTLTFMDPFGQVVLREVVYPITPQTPALKGEAAEPLHLTFEHLPAEWNEGPPVITPTYVSF
ncbi:MAG: hypothetical protein ACRD22_22550 [Terriglobia bacterium]